MADDQAQLPAHLRWAKHGSCWNSDTPDLWFPEDGDHKSAWEARAICDTCPVRDDCLRYALENGFTDGVFGGTTPRMRRRRKQQYLAELSA